MKMKVSLSNSFQRQSMMLNRIRHLNNLFFFLVTDDDEDEDDVIQLPLRSYVESNEEMTESDCNVQEDDERTGTHESPTYICIWRYTHVLSLNVSIGGGSASDSGRSIASSVSTEPFFSGQSQSVATETQPATAAPEANATQNATQTTAAEGDANASTNNNEQSTPNAIAPTTSNVVAETHPEDTNESQDTNELKDQESASNDDNADNMDVINVYSSGDEGMFFFLIKFP